MTIEAPAITPPALSRIVPLIDEAISGRTACAPPRVSPLAATWSEAHTWTNSSAAAANISGSSPRVTTPGPSSLPRLYNNVVDGAVGGRAPHDARSIRPEQHGRTAGHGH